MRVFSTFDVAGVFTECEMAFTMNCTTYHEIAIFFSPAKHVLWAAVVKADLWTFIKGYTPVYHAIVISRPPLKYAPIKVGSPKYQNYKKNKT